MVGLQTGGEDGCVAAGNLESATGYLFAVEMVGIPSGGSTYTLTADSENSGEAEVFFENTGGGTPEESTASGGSFTVDRYSSTGTMSISDFDFVLDGGSNLTGGELTACYCADVPLP